MTVKPDTRWTNVWIIALCLTPLAIIVGYLIVLAHFLIKFW